MASSQLQIEKKHFRKLRLQFIDKLDDLPNFIDHAITVDLFTLRHRNEIMSCQNIDDQKRKMLDIVEKKLTRRSKQFLEALINSGNDILAKKLIPPETGISNNHLQKVFKMEIGPVEFQNINNNKYPIDIQTFRRFRVEFITHMSYMPIFIDYSLEMNLLSKRHKNEILSIENPDEQSRRLCDIMETKLPEKSDIFLYCLTKSRNHHLVVKLTSRLNVSTATCDYSHLKFPMEKCGVLKVLDMDLGDVLHLYMSGLDCSSFPSSSFVSKFGDLRKCINTLSTQYKTDYDFVKSSLDSLVPRIWSVYSSEDGKDLQLDFEEETGSCYGRPSRRLLTGSFKYGEETIYIRIYGQWGNVEVTTCVISIFGWRDNLVTGIINSVTCKPVTQFGGAIDV